MQDSQRFESCLIRSASYECIKPTHALHKQDNAISMTLRDTRTPQHTMYLLCWQRVLGLIIANQPELWDRIVFVIADKQVIGSNVHNVVLWFLSP